MMELKDLYELCNICSKPTPEGWSVPKWLVEMLPDQYTAGLSTHYVIDWKEHGL